MVLGTWFTLFSFTRRRVIRAGKLGFDITAYRLSFSRSGLEVDARKRYILAGDALTTSKLDSFWTCRSSSNVLEGNIADLNLRGSLQAGKPTKNIIKVFSSSSFSCVHHEH